MKRRLIDLGRYAQIADADSRAWQPDLYTHQANEQRITEHHVLELTAAVGRLGAAIATHQRTPSGWESPDLTRLARPLADALDALLLLAHHHGIDLVDAHEHRRQDLTRVHGTSGDPAPRWPDRVIVDALDWLLTDLTRQAAEYATADEPKGEEQHVYRGSLTVTEWADLLARTIETFEWSCEHDSDRVEELDPHNGEWDAPGVRTTAHLENAITSGAVYRIVVGGDTR